MNFSAFETAVQSQIRAASGLATIWANQTRDRPARPFVELNVLETQVSDHDEESFGDNPSPTPGAELITTSKQHVEVRVQVRVFSSAVVGNSRAANVAQTIRSRLSFDSVAEVLWAADVAVIERGNVRDATIVLESEHEGRAVFDIRFRVGVWETETTTYIEAAEIETTVEQTTGPVVSTFTVP